MTREDNRRRHSRYNADKLDGNFSYSVEANVLNLSLGGFAVRSSTQLRIGHGYRFRLGSGAKQLELSGTVRWCRMAGTQRLEGGDIVPVYEAGIAFDEVLSSRAEDLLRFMEHNIILQVKPRVFGRLQVDSEDEVTLESSGEFVVLELSTSGMMIESGVGLKPESELDLSMRLGRRTFSSRARVVYTTEVEAADNERKFRMGLEFQDTANKYVAMLESFIRRELKRSGAKSSPTKG